LTFDDLQSVRYPDWGVDVSPNGEAFAYGVGEVLWIFDIEKGSRKQIGKGTIPRWSPDGTRVAFYSKEEGRQQLWLYDVPAGASIKLTNIEGGISPDPQSRLLGWIGDPFRYGWSTDGKRIVFTSRVLSKRRKEPSALLSDTVRGPGASGKNKPLVLTTTTPQYWTFSGLFRHSGNPVYETENEDEELRLPARTNQLFTLDVSTKKVRQLTEDDAGCFTPDWSPDGSKIVCTSTEGRSMVGYGPDASNLYLIDVETNGKIALTAGPGLKRLPTWSPDGKRIAYLGGVQFGSSHLFMLPSTGGDPVRIAPQLNRSIFSAFAWEPDGQFLVTSFQDGVSLSIVRISISTGRVQRLSQSDVTCLPFGGSRSGTVVWSQGDSSSVGVFYAADSAGSRVRLLFELNPQIREWSLGKQEVLRWKNKRGDEIEGILIKPVGYQKGREYPLIVDPYPGQLNALAVDPMGGNHAFAANGYMVFYPNERTPHTWMNPVKDEAYDEASRGPDGVAVMMDDLMSGIDNLVTQGLVDRKRMCLFGFSNGGGAVNLILMNTNQFRCAVSASGVGPDWALSFFMDGDSTFPRMIGNKTPWESPESYNKLSVVYHLDKVTTPLLLAVGDDEETEVIQQIAIYNGLRYLGRDVTLLRYPGQGHGFTGESLRDYWTRVNSFFDMYLKREKEASNSAPAEH
jgi:dipeptidyl aminopeptidase/acylaminoacyl peptidase